MKKLNSLVLLLVLVVTAGVLLPVVSYAASAEDVVIQANELRTEAAKEKSSKVRDEKYKKAVDLYQRIIKKSDTDPVEAAQAKFEMAILRATATGDYSNKRQAIDLYGELVTAYDKPVAELKKDFTPEEAEDLKAIGLQSRTNRTALTQELDKENSKKWQYKLMDWLVALTGRNPAFSYWFALLLLTVMVKILITPLTKAQFKSMKEMQRIQPLLKELQEKYRNDQQKLQSEMMKLYKEHGVNPFASCLPLLVQMPILIGLYGVISAYQYQFEKGFFLWIGSPISHIFQVFVPLANKVVWFTAANLSEPDLLLVLLYLVSMFISQKISIVDPTQAEQQKMMSIMFPIMFGFLFAGFPSAFIFYWLVFNILQTVQQYRIIHSGQQETPVVAAGPAGGPKAPESGSTDSDRVTRRPSGSRSRRRRR